MNCIRLVASLFSINSSINKISIIYWTVTFIRANQRVEFYWLCSYYPQIITSSLLLLLRFFFLFRHFSWSRQTIKTHLSSLILDGSSEDRGEMRESAKLFCHASGCSWFHICSSLEDLQHCSCSVIYVCVRWWNHTFILSTHVCRQTCKCARTDALTSQTLHQNREDKSLGKLWQRFND